MTIDRQKLAYAISAIWGLASLPVSEFIYDDVLDESGLFIRLFALVLTLAPVWIVFGWRWLTNSRPIPAPLWLSVSAVAVFITFGFASDGYLDDLAWIPILALVVFLLLVWTFERGNMLWWRKKSLEEILPTPTDFSAGVKSLIKLTEDLSNDVLAELRRLAPDLKLPIPIHETESLLCAYGMVYFNLLEHGFRNRSDVVAVFSGYKSMMITNYISTTVPKKMREIGELIDFASKEPVREPTKELLKMREEAADTVRDNLARNGAYPFYPLYDGLRPFVGGAGATASDLNIAFDSLFANWNGKAKRGIESLLRQLS